MRRGFRADTHHAIDTCANQNRVLKMNHELPKLTYSARLKARLLTIALAHLLLFGCSEVNESGSNEAMPSREDPEFLEKRGELINGKLPERAPILDEPVTGEVPAAVMATVHQALEKLTGADRSDFNIVKSEEVIWPNGALGCPQPGMHYTQAQISGYQIVLEHNGREYDYRTGETRSLMLCLEPMKGFRPGTPAPVR